MAVAIEAGPIFHHKGNFPLDRMAMSQPASFVHQSISRSRICRGGDEGSTVTLDIAEAIPQQLHAWKTWLCSHSWLPIANVVNQARHSSRRRGRGNDGFLFRVINPELPTTRPDQYSLTKTNTAASNTILRSLYYSRTKTWTKPKPKPHTMRDTKRRIRCSFSLRQHIEKQICKTYILPYIKQNASPQT